MDGLIALGASKKFTKDYTALYLTSGAIPKGSWNASTNTPTLTQGSGTVGWYYDVIQAGTWDGKSFLVGDRIIFTPSNKWERVPTGVESEAPMVVAYVDENTTAFPTTRPSGLPLKNGDYVSVKSTAILPFEIENISGEKIPFDAYGDKAEFNGEDWQEKSYEAGKTNEIGIKNPVEEGVTGDEEYQNELNKKYSNEIKIGKSVISVKRLGEYLYEATYDGIADYVEGANPVIGGCSSFVRGGKTYRSFDLKYNNVAEFLVKTKDFDGIALIQGMNDGNLDKEKITQLPYHLADGCNRHGIVVTEHILFNDFNFDGTGTKENDLTKLPTIILQNVKSMEELTTNVIVNNFLANAKLPTALEDLEYALHFLITDGTTTYTLCPKDDGSGYEFINISVLPKQTNFKWVNKAILERNDSDLQERPTGIERWNLIGSDVTLKDLRFTKAYETNERLSEFIGIDGTTKDSTDAELEAIYEEAHTEYLDRKRDGKTWQSVHSIVYGENGIEHLWVQENYIKNYIPQEGGGGGGIEIVDELPENFKDDSIYKINKEVKSVIYYKGSTGTRYIGEVLTTGIKITNKTTGEVFTTIDWANTPGNLGQFVTDGAFVVADIDVDTNCFVVYRVGDIPDKAEYVNDKPIEFDKVKGLFTSFDGELKSFGLLREKITHADWETKRKQGKLDYNTIYEFTDASPDADDGKIHDINSASDFPSTIKENDIYRINADITVSGTTYTKGLYQGKNNTLVRLIAKDELDTKENIVNFVNGSRDQLYNLIPERGHMIGCFHMLASESPDGGAVDYSLTAKNINGISLELEVMRLSTNRKYFCVGNKNGTTITWSSWKEIGKAPKMVKVTNLTNIDTTATYAWILQDGTEMCVFDTGDEYVNATIRIVAKVGGNITTVTNQRAVILGIGTTRLYLYDAVCPSCFVSPSGNIAPLIMCSMNSSSVGMWATYANSVTTSHTIYCSMRCYVRRSDLVTAGVLS